MPIHLVCACGKKLRAPEQLAGRRVKCPHCSASLAIPALPAQPTTGGGLTAGDDVGLAPLEPSPTRPQQAEEADLTPIAFAKSKKSAPKAKAVYDNDLDLNPYGLAAGEKLGLGRPGEVKCIRLTKAKEPVNCLAIAATQPLALANVGPQLFLFDVYGQAKPRRFEEHDEPVRSAAISADGTNAVSGDEDGQILVWDLVKGRVLKRCRVVEGAVTSLALSPCKRFAVAGGTEGQLVAWRLETGGRHALADPDWSSAVVSVAYAADGKHILATGCDGVAMWRTTTCKLVHRFDDFATPITQVEFAANGKHILAAAWGSLCVFRWDRESGLPDKMLTEPADNLMEFHALALASDGERVVTVAELKPPELPQAGDSFGDHLLKGAAASLLSGTLGVPYFLTRFAIEGIGTMSSGPEQQASKFFLQVWNLDNPEGAETYELMHAVPASMLASASLHCALLGGHNGAVYQHAFLP